MKKYNIEVMRYDGTVLYRSINADSIHIEDGVIKFVNDGGSIWITVAVYPANKTIISNIENIK